MTGEAIDWNAASPERIKSVAVWVGITAVVAVAAFKLPLERFKKLAGIVSGVLMLLLAVTLTLLLLTTRLVDKTAQLSSTKINEFQLSSDKNLVVLVLDAMDGKAFQRAVDRDPEYKQLFQDFTFFNDAAAGYPYTALSVPQILSGQWYENQEPLDLFTSNAIDSSPLIQALESESYKIGIYEQGDITLYQPQHEGRYENQILSLTSAASIPTTGKMLLKMAGVRYAPWDLKRYCYDLYNYSVSDHSLGQDMIFRWSNQTFFDELKDSNPISVVQDKCFRFIHLEGPHLPFMFNKNMEVIPGGTTYDDCVDASLTLCRLYIQRLKESGVYDNSAIVIMADHGFAPEYTGTSNSPLARMNPCLLIKGMGESGESMRVSSAPVSYEDIADAFVELLRGKASTETFPYADGDVRERRLLIYSYEYEIKDTYEYFLNGSASDPEAMTPSGKVYAYIK